MWQSLCGRAAFHAHDLHERYGPVVRLTPNHLSFTDIRAWRDIYGHRIAPGPGPALSSPGTGSHSQDDQHGSAPPFLDENPKSPIHYAAVPDVPPSILQAPRDEHSLLRRALSHGFSEKALRSQEGRIKRYVDFLLLRLRQSSGGGAEKLDIGKRYNWVTFDITGDLVFAEPFGCLDRQEYHPFVEMIVGTIQGGAVLVVLNYLGLGFVLRVIWAMGVRKLVTKMRGEMAERLEKRIEARVEVEDLFEGLMKHREDWVRSLPPPLPNAPALCHLVATIGRKVHEADGRGCRALEWTA
jgi:cytochrome P450